MINGAEGHATESDSGPSSVTYIHNCGVGKQSTESVYDLANLMRATRKRYGAPGPESAREALVRVETFIANHQTCGDLVFEKRVASALITGDVLVELHTDVTALWDELESHTDSVATTSSCVIDDNRRYVFAVTPIQSRRFIRRNRHWANIIELVSAAGFTLIAAGNAQGMA